MPEKITAQDHRAHPEDAAEDIENEVAGVGHSGGAGYRRAKRSDDGNEARQDDGPATIFFIEVMGALKMASPEKEGIFAPVQSGTGRAADPIADLVAYDGAQHNGQE